jgi:hypothetical protein
MLGAEQGHVMEVRVASQASIRETADIQREGEGAVSAGVWSPGATITVSARLSWGADETLREYLNEPELVYFAEVNVAGVLEDETAGIPFMNEIGVSTLLRSSCGSAPLGS